MRAGRLLILPLLAACSLPAWAENDSHDMDAAMDNMQGGSAPPDARDPHAYSDGLEMEMLPGMDMADDEPYYLILTEELEYFNGNDGNGFQFDGQAWVGGDIHKLWLEFEGGRQNGEASATRTELLWDRNIATYWSTQLGVRHDFEGGPSRSWLAFGVQGLAPYWFEVEAMGYVGESGRTAFRGEVSYDLLLSQRLVLQPNVEVSLYGKDDADREIGSGLSEVEMGLRLRYEIQREFAPYIGLYYRRAYGDTADFAEAGGEDIDETRLMIGLRLWY